MTCPVVKVIGEIRGGGVYTEDTASIKLGGSDGTELVCDSVSFHIMTRRLELARFELARPTVEKCREFAARFFTDVAGKQLGVVCNAVIDASSGSKYLYEQFTRLVDLVANMESYIELRVDSAARAGGGVNVSLPDVIMLPHVDRLILYRCDVLAVTVNRLVDYVNRLDVSCLTKTGARPNVKPIDAPQMKRVDMRTTVPTPTGVDAESMLRTMHTALDVEMTAAAYALEIEKYQCVAINKLGEVHDACRRIVGDL